MPDSFLYCGARAMAIHLLDCANHDLFYNRNSEDFHFSKDRESEVADLSARISVDLSFICPINWSVPAPLELDLCGFASFTLLLYCDHHYLRLI